MRTTALFHTPWQLYGSTEGDETVVPPSSVCPPAAASLDEKFAYLEMLHRRCMSGTATRADRDRLVAMAKEFEELAGRTVATKAAAESKLKKEVADMVRLFMRVQIDNMIPLVLSHIDSV